MPPFPDPPDSLAAGGARLRLAAERDIPEVLIAHQDDPDLARALGLARPPSASELGRRTERAAAERAHGEGVWLTVLREGDDECRGQLDLVDIDSDHRRAALRIWITPRDRGHGLGRAALSLAGRWLLSECDLERIALHAETGNPALTRAALAAGFHAEGVLRGHRLRADGRRADVELLSLVAADLGPPSG